MSSYIPFWMAEAASAAMLGAVAYSSAEALPGAWPTRIGARSRGREQQPASPPRKRIPLRPRQIRLAAEFGGAIADANSYALVPAQMLGGEGTNFRGEVAKSVARVRGAVITAGAKWAASTAMAASAVDAAEPRGGVIYRVIAPKSFVVVPGPTIYLVTDVPERGTPPRRGTRSPAPAPDRLAHVIAMDAHRERAATAIADGVALPDWAALAGSLLTDRRHVVSAIDRIVRPLRQRITAAALNGICIALLAQKTQGYPIVIRARFSADEVPSFDSPEAALEYWRVRLDLDEQQVADLRMNIRALYAGSEAVAGDIHRATLTQMGNFIRTVAGENLGPTAFAKAFELSVGGKVRGMVDAAIRTEQARTYSEQTMAHAREGSITGNQTTPFLQFLSVRDNRRTPICRAMDGYIAATDDDVWLRLTPPLHYNCRSAISLIGYREAIRRGIAALAPDGRSIVLTRGPRPYGDPPPVEAEDGFGTGEVAA